MHTLLTLFFKAVIFSMFCYLFEIMYESIINLFDIFENRFITRIIKVFVGFGTFFALALIYCVLTNFLYQIGFFTILKFF